MKHLIKDFEEYNRIYNESVSDPERFWSEVAEGFQWRKKWDKVLEWDFGKPEVKWFINGKLNITENCLDRHLEKRGNQTAIIWEPSNPSDEAKHITYKELHSKVCQTANMLKNLEVKKGDRVCIYLPMIPELAYAMMACARIGAVHSVVFAGFSSKSLVARITDAGCKIVLTSDGGFRGAKTIDLKGIVDAAVDKCPDVEKVLVVDHIHSKPVMKAGRDLWWQSEFEKANVECKAEEMDAEDLLFILYTSGSTGRPKGMVHTSGGYTVYTDYTFRTAFQYKEGQVYWCTADIGWITGHS
ncbi:MAG: AMP-binding protein, partial [Cyclobacteriaceae bacterium]